MVLTAFASVYKEEKNINFIPEKIEPVSLDKFKEQLNNSYVKDGEDYYDILDDYDFYKDKYCKKNAYDSFCYVKLNDDIKYNKMIDIYINNIVLEEHELSNIRDYKTHYNNYNRDEITVEDGKYIFIMIDDVAVFNINPSKYIDYHFLHNIGYYNTNPTRKDPQGKSVLLFILKEFAIIYIIVEFSYLIFKLIKKRRKR